MAISKLLDFGVTEVPVSLFSGGHGAVTRGKGKVNTKLELTLRRMTGGNVSRATSLGREERRELRMLKTLREGGDEM